MTGAWVGQRDDHHAHGDADPCLERLQRPEGDAVMDRKHILMDNIAGTKSSLTWAVHISVAALVLLWIFPTLGLLVSSFRTTDQIRSSGWWAAMFPAVQNETFRTADPDDFRVDLGDGRFMVEGNLYVVDGRVGDRRGRRGRDFRLGHVLRAIDAYQAGDTADLGDGETMTVQSNGDYRWEGNDEQLSGRGQRVFVTAESPPEFTLNNYAVRAVRSRQPGGDGQGLLQHADGDDPGDDHPDPDRGLRGLCAGVDGVSGPRAIGRGCGGASGGAAAAGADPASVAAQRVGIGKGYLGVWLAHTGFGLPLAIYLLRNYMVGLPREVIENARVDGATEFQIFTKIILPLSFPALASFAIFQFLWTWNDLLVAMVFLIDANGRDHGDDAPDRRDCWARAAATGKSSPPRPSCRSRCRWWCSSRCSATSCAACWPVR
jgi:alpha-glucoside transport system permease protein